jgi:uncharacterized membrane protein YkoI
MLRSSLLAVATLLCTAAPALADHGRGGDEAATHAHAAIPQARALEIAAAQGVARVREVELRRGVWKVEGFTAQGRAVEVEIDAHSGEVVKREFY